jgi:hypothetical protein
MPVKSQIKGEDIKQLNACKITDQRLSQQTTNTCKITDQRLQQ